MIDADVLVERWKRMASNSWNEAIATSWSNAYEEIISEIEEEPTIEAEPLRHARWIKEYDFEENYSIHKCSNCGGEPYYESDIEKEYHYCPYCGAKMDKKSPENHKKYQE